MFVKKRTAAEAASPRVHTSGSVLFTVILILTLSTALLPSCKGKQNETTAVPAQTGQLQDSRQPESTANTSADSPATTRAETAEAADNTEAAPPLVQENSAAPARTGNENTSAAVSMQPRPRPQAAAASGSGTITVASNLSGSDRHLIHRPLDRILPEDFIIGSLQNPAAAGQAVSGLLQAAIQNLKQGELPASLMSPEIRLLASVLYAADLKAADTVKEIRLGAFQNGRAGILEVPFRLIGDSYRSRGLLVLDPVADPPMIIHFTFNNRGLSESYIAPESFDPHGVLY